MPSQMFCALNSKPASSRTVGLKDCTCSSSLARSALEPPSETFPPYSIGEASPPPPERLGGSAYPGSSSAIGAWSRVSTALRRLGSSYQMVQPPWERRLRLLQFLPLLGQLRWYHTYTMRASRWSMTCRGVGIFVKTLISVQSHCQKPFRGFALSSISGHLKSTQLFFDPETTLV